MKQAGSALAVVVWFCASWGCDGGGGGRDAGPTGSDAGGGTDAGGGGMAVDILIEARDARDQSPLAGAQIAVDHPDGTRDEQTTDASGRATFSVVWDDGPIAVTAYRDGYAIASFLGVTREVHERFLEDGAVPALMNANTDPPRVTLSGTVANVTDATHRVQVSVNDPRVIASNNVGPDYTLDVPPDRSLVITATEYATTYRGPNDYEYDLIAASTLEVGPFGADTTLDLDLTENPVTWTDVTGTVAAPGMGTPLADAGFSVVVGDRVDGSFYGTASSVAVSGADLSYGVRYFEAPGARQPFTRYVLSDDPLFSEVVVPGWPTGGAQTFTFLPPPTIVSPAFGESHALHDPFTLGRLPAGAEVSLQIYDINQDDRLLWQILHTTGSDTITVPALPSGASASAIFPAGADLYARPLVCEREGANRYCTRLAVGARQFDLVP